MFLFSALLFISIFILLALLAWTDHKIYILPNTYNLALLICYAGFHFTIGWVFITPQQALLGFIAGGGFLLIVRAIANKIMQMDTIGLGDVKLMMAAGFGVGLEQIFLVLSLGSALGVLHGAFLYLKNKKQGDAETSLNYTNVPAGVGLCIATAFITAYQFQNFYKVF